MEFEFRFMKEEIEALGTIVPGPNYEIVAHELARPKELRTLSLSDAVHLGLTSHIYAKAEVSRVRSLSLEKLGRPGQYFHVVDDLMMPDHINMFAHLGSSQVLPRIALSLPPRFSVDETHVTAPPSPEFRRLFNNFKRRLKSMGRSVRHHQFVILLSSLAIEAVKTGECSSGDRELDKAISHL